MLKSWSKPKRPDEDELEMRLRAEREKLEKNQIKVKEGKIPVFIVFEGWGAAGKGSVTGRIIKNMDPRFFKVESVKEPTEEELRKPFLYRYFIRIPEAGRFTFLDSSWMKEVVTDKIKGELSQKDYRSEIDSVKRFERTLADNGYLMMKFFLHIDEKEQKRRLNGLKKDKSTSWRVSEKDMYQNKN